MTCRHPVLWADVPSYYVAISLMLIEICYDFTYAVTLQRDIGGVLTFKVVAMVVVADARMAMADVDKKTEGFMIEMGFRDFVDLILYQQFGNE